MILQKSFLEKPPNCHDMPNLPNLNTFLRIIILHDIKSLRLNYRCINYAVFKFALLIPLKILALCQKTSASQTVKNDVFYRPMCCIFYLSAPVHFRHLRRVNMSVNHRLHITTAELDFLLDAFVDERPHNHPHQVKSVRHVHHVSFVLSLFEELRHHLEHFTDFLLWEFSINK